MPHRLAVFEISHRTARRTLRDELARGGADWITDRVAHVGAIDEWRLLSTCGRFELYVVADDHTLATLRSSLRATWCRAQGSMIERRGFEAVAHLFRVAAGLESPILGEDEILGQVRNMLDMGGSGDLLERMIQQAVYVGRRVRQETELNASRVSYAERALQAATDFLPAQGKLTIYGTGQLARSVAGAVNGSGLELSISSRHNVRRQSLAAEFGARCVSADNLKDHLRDQDVLIGCTAARQPIITAETISTKREKPLLVIDLGLPANVADEVAVLPMVTLITLDELVDDQAHHDPAVEAAEEIICDALRRFKTWRAMQSVGMQVQAVMADSEVSPAERHARIRALKDSVA